MLPLPATPATAAFAAPPAAPLVAEARAVLTGQYYFIVIVHSNSIQLVACFLYRLCIIKIIVSLYLPATPAATPSRFYGRVPPPARPRK